MTSMSPTILEHCTSCTESKGKRGRVAIYYRTARAAQEGRSQIPPACFRCMYAFFFSVFFSFLFFFTTIFYQKSELNLTISKLNLA